VLLAVLAACATADGDPRDPFEGFNAASTSSTRRRRSDRQAGATLIAISCTRRSATGCAISFPTSRSFHRRQRPAAGKLQDAWRTGRASPSTALRLLAFTTWRPTWGSRSTTRISADPGPLALRRSVSRAADSGSSTLRDSVEPRPTSIRSGQRFQADQAAQFAVALRLVGVRADLLEASRILEEAALDKYTFQRDAYLQRRRSLIYDGQPRARSAFEKIAASGRPSTWSLPRALIT